MHFSPASTRPQPGHGLALLRGALAAITLCLAGMAHAQDTGDVRAIANTDAASSSTAASVSAEDGSFSASASRVATLASGSTGNRFTALRTEAAASTTSFFSVVGLLAEVPLTFHWEFSGERSWDVDNGAFIGRVVAEVHTGNFINRMRWGINYADGRPIEGDFAGSLTNDFTLSTGGTAYANTVPSGQWDGQGSQQASTTLLRAADGMEGSFSLESAFGISGDTIATYASRLVAVSAADTSLLAPGAHLLLDNGMQILITSAVPEAQTWAMLVSGLLAMGLIARRRQA